MNQLALSFSPRARRRDPETSRVAAEKARSFSARHAAKIWTCLKDFGALTPREVSERTGLEYHAVQRRGLEMETAKLITRVPDERDGMRIWRAA